MEWDARADGEDREWSTDRFLSDMDQLEKENTALRAEVERLREERRWRDATTESPNNDGAYSCLWWTGDVSTEYWYHDTWLGAADHVVTHWMPLPTLPEKDEPWRSTNNHYDDWPL